MVRILTDVIYQGDMRYIEGACLYGDDKPVDGIVTGSVMIEVDTGNVYLFDETEGGSWVKLGDSGGSSGGDSGEK